MEFDFGELIVEDEIEFGELELDIIQDTPPLINLEVTPTNEEQIFNHEGSYGYDEVKVNAVIGETLNIAPNKEEQKFNGVYTEVNVGSIKLQNKVVTPTQEEQIIIADEEYNGLGQVTVEKVEPAEPIAIPYKPKWLSFYGCKETDLSEELSNIDGSELTSLYYAFYNCSNLKRLDFSNLDLSGVTDMSYTFYRCSSLEFLDLRTINIAGANNVGGMTFNRVPANCLVIVKDETDKTEVTSANVNFTNVKTVAEYENS